MAVWIALGAVFISLMMMGVALYAANQKKKNGQGGLPPM
jgi:hypothetical protein